MMFEIFNHNGNRFGVCAFFFFAVASKNYFFLAVFVLIPAFAWCFHGCVNIMFENLEREGERKSQ